MESLQKVPLLQTTAEICDLRAKMASWRGHVVKTLPLPVKCYSLIERTAFFFFFYLCMMNACASQIFWSISSPVIRDLSRLLLNFNGSHKVSVSARRLVLPSARQSAAILYFHRWSRLVWCCYLTLSDILMGCFLAFWYYYYKDQNDLWKLIYSLRRCEEITVYSVYLHGWWSHTWLHFFTRRAADICKLHTYYITIILWS